MGSTCLGLVCLRHGCSCWTATLLRGVAVMSLATQGTAHADGAAAVHHRQDVLWSPPFGTKTVDSGELRRGQLYASLIARHRHHTGGNEDSSKRPPSLSQCCRDPSSDHAVGQPARHDVSVWKIYEISQFSGSGYGYKKLDSKQHQ